MTTQGGASVRRLVRCGLAVIALWGAQPAPAQAQSTYPNRPIRIMLPFAAGSVSDVTMRILADKLGVRLGASVIIDNQPRAGGVTAATTTMSAGADGYTVVILSSSTAISVSLLNSLPYDPVTDFVPVSGVSTFANVIAANGQSKYRSFADVLKEARARPGQLNVGTTTVGSTNHLAATLLRSMTGLDFVIVPFRTPGELVTAAVRNDVDLIIQSYGALKSALADKQLTGLATTTAQRASYAKDIPTLEESGVKGFEVVTWNGMFAPARTPPEVIEKLNRELRATLDEPEVKRRFLELGLEPAGGTPAALGTLLKDEIGKWGRVIAEAKIEKQ